MARPFPHTRTSHGRFQLGTEKPTTRSHSTAQHAPTHAGRGPAAQSGAALCRAERAAPGGGGGRRRREEQVDVRDVGKAHLNAALNIKSNGRYILSSESVSFLELGKILSDSFGNVYPFPKREAPKFLFWLLAPFFGVKRNFVSNNAGYAVYFNNSKSISELNINYRPVKVSAIDFFQQLIETDL